MGCGNSKVENSARKPQTNRTNRGGRQKASTKDDMENDKNNNDTGRKSQAQSNTYSNKSKKSTQKTQNSTGYGDDDELSQKRHQKVAVTEKGYKARIRMNLRNATAGTDIEYLEKCMEVFRNNKMEDGGDYSEALDRLEHLKLRREIKEACMRDHPEVLDNAIRKVEASPYKRQLKPYLDKAYYLKQHQNELDTWRHDISNMDQATISEIRSYNYPPGGVHETMIATYLICGYPEQHLTDWNEITALMGRYGKDSLIREVQTVDQKNIDKNTALRARHYLGQYSLDEVRTVSNGAAAFYVWSSRMVGKNDVDRKSNTPGSKTRASGQQSNSKPVTPADSGKTAKTQKQQMNNSIKQNSTNKR